MAMSMTSRMALSVRVRSTSGINLFHHFVLLFVLLIHDSRQDSRDEEEDDVRNAETPCRLRERTIMVVTPDASIPVIINIHPRWPNLLAVRRVYHTGDWSDDAFDVGDVGEENHACDECREEANVKEGHPQRCVSCTHGGDEDAEGPYRGEEGDDEEADNTGWWGDPIFVPHINQGG